ncbi:MAG TPA: D-aminoacylase [Thermomicrobiales bacterium]
MFDLIIRNGTLVDGTGAPPRRADLGIAGNRIAAIGDLAAQTAAISLDAEGKVVAPGFVDIHSHSDFTLLVDPRAQSSIAQGVTTEVIGNCGHGCAPIARADQVTGNIYGYLPGFPLDWATTASYLERLEQAHPAVNVVPLVPNGNLRLATLGLDDRPATPDERREMASLLEEGLEAGAFGFSTGLEYPSERATTEEETVCLCRVVARRGGIYTTHTRNRDVHAVAAIEEAVRVATTAGVPLQVSHLIPRRGGPPDTLERAIAVVDRARSHGLDVAFDAHTRLHGITNLSAALPSWALAGGPPALAARLRDPAVRDRLRRHESIISSFGLGGWDRVFLFRSERRPDLVGKSFAEIAGPGGDPFDAVFDVLLAEAADPHAPMVVCLSYEEDELLFAYCHGLCTIGSDATALATDGPLAGSTFLGAYTWAAWFFRRFVRERAAFTLEAAIQKLADAPARRFGLADRGRLAEGCRADVVVFDPATFAEQGTLDAPNRPATGMDHVVVNGVVTLQNGEATGDRGGEVLRRS